jgi:hypothetical protein
MKPKSSILNGVLLFIGGLAFLSGSAYIINDRLAFLSNSSKAEATIIDQESRRGRDKTTYYPVISFQDDNGQTITFTSEVGSSSQFDYVKGDKVNVRYNQEKPQNAKISSFLVLWGLPASLLVLSFVLLVVGGKIIFLLLKK